MPEGMLGMIIVQREGDVRARVVERALLHHGLGAPARTGYRRRRRPSSRGLEDELDRARICSRMPASTSATAISIAVWPSWPQACMTGDSTPMFICLTCDAKGRPVTSATGGASCRRAALLMTPAARPGAGRPRRGRRRQCAPPCRACAGARRPAPQCALRPDGSGVLVDVAPPFHHARLDGVEAGGERLRVASSSAWAGGARPGRKQGGAAAKAQHRECSPGCFSFWILSEQGWEGRTITRAMRRGRPGKRRSRPLSNYFA